MKRILSAVIAVVVLTGVAHAGKAPVAVVEDVKGKVTGAEFMDYVVPGQVIKLGPGASITIGYMRSCWREVISGAGTVVIGTELSSIDQAKFNAGKVHCDSSLAEQIGKEVGESAATVVRSLSDPSDKKQLVLHGLSPMVSVPERGKLIIERIDATGEHHEVDLTKAPLARGKFYDLAKAHIELQPGGAYSMKLNAKYVTFLVDADATSGAGPVIGRLVVLR